MFYPLGENSPKTLGGCHPYSASISSDPSLPLPPFPSPIPLALLEFSSILTTPSLRKSGIRDPPLSGNRFAVTVEPRYFKLDLFEVPAISKEDRMPLDLPFPFTLPRLFRNPAISNFFPFLMGLRNSEVRLYLSINNCICVMIMKMTELLRPKISIPKTEKSASLLKFSD